jgi:hypothetical protein
MSALITKWSNKWALVTGASAGIGLELARHLAAAKTNLVLTARRTDRLQSLADEFSQKFSIKIEVCAADLTDPAAPERIFAFTQSRGIQISLLVNNAGFGAFGYMHKIPPAKSADGRAAQRRHPHRLLHRGFPAGPVQCLLRGHQGLRSDLRGKHRRGTPGVRR